MLFLIPKLSTNFCTYTLHELRYVGHNMGTWRRNLPHFRSAKLKNILFFSWNCILLNCWMYSTFLYSLPEYKSLLPIFIFIFFFSNDWLFYSSMNERIIGSVCTYKFFVFFFLEGKHTHVQCVTTNVLFLTEKNNRSEKTW